MLTTAFGVTVIIFNQAFLNYWVGREHFAGHAANILIMLITMQDTFVKNDACIISATLDIKKKVLLTFFSAVLFAGFGVLLVSRFGIVGLCLSLMISRAFLYIGQRRILAAVVKTETRTPLTGNYRSFLTSLLMLGTAAWLATKTGSIGMYQLLVLVPITFVVAIPVFYFIGWSRSDRSAFWQVVSSIKFFKSDSGFSRN